MTRLIDTTLRLLGQEPLAGRIPTGRLLDLCSELDEVGYHALEVSGGGCFREAIVRGVESPWERIRLYRQRATRTPLVMAHWWFSVGNWSKFIALPAAPPFGSLARKTTRSRRVWTIAPAHMGQGSFVT